MSPYSCTHVSVLMYSCLKTSSLVLISAQNCTFVHYSVHFSLMFVNFVLVNSEF